MFITPFNIQNAYLFIILNNYFVIDIFYCNCNFCHRTEICGRGFTIKLNEDEKKILNLHCQYDWWNKFD